MARTAIEFPPGSKGASFNLEAVKEQTSRPGGVRGKVTENVRKGVLGRKPHEVNPPFRQRRHKPATTAIAE